jgi:hypothetical protein
MGEVIPFKRCTQGVSLTVPAGFSVNVWPTDGAWLVVSRNHSWLHPTRKAAIRDASDIAAGFGVSVVIYGGARA